MFAGQLTVDIDPADLINSAEVEPDEALVETLG